MSDRLTLARALEDSGIASVAADRVATEIYSAIHDSVVTKSDIAALETSTKADIAAVRTDIVTMRRDIQTDITALENSTKANIVTFEASTKADIAIVRADMSARFAAVEGRFHQLELRLVLRLGGFIAAVAGVLFGALHYWPPHP